MTSFPLTAMTFCGSTIHLGGAVFIETAMFVLCWSEKEMRKKGREGKVREATNKETERVKESLLVREAVEKNTVENTVDRR